jgi:putative FmdB family regulatory protein
MPTYVYSATPPEPPAQPAATCDVCSGTFEVVQRMSEDALTKCPKCGGAIQRVIMAPNLNGAGTVKKPSADRLAKAGFTQYKRVGKGNYEKSFGSGPESLQP